MAVTNTTITSVGANLFSDTNNANVAVTIKGSSTTVTQWDIDNTANVAQSFCKIYNSAGAITVGTTVPDEIIMVAASTRIQLVIPTGKIYGTGCQIATTTTAILAGATSPGSAVLIKAVYT